MDTSQAEQEPEWRSPFDGLSREEVLAVAERRLAELGTDMSGLVEYLSLERLSPAGEEIAHYRLTARSLVGPGQSVTFALRFRVPDSGFDADLIDTWMMEAMYEDAEALLRSGATEIDIRL